MSKSGIDISVHDGDPECVVIRGDRSALLELAVACIQVADGTNGAEIHPEDLQMSNFPRVAYIIVDRLP